MAHDVEDWEQHYNNDEYYAGYDISKFPIQDGFERGDLLVLQGISSPADIAIGDVVVVDRGPDAMPLVHRVVAIWEENGDARFMLKGDHNPEPHEYYYEDGTMVLGDYPIYPQQIKGKVIFVIPKLGYISLWFQGN
jgi:signal peptidase I